MRKITLFLMSLFLTVGAMAQVVYTPNHTGAKTKTDRMLASISVGNDTYTMPSGTDATRYSYTDLTDEKTFTVQAGTTVTLGMTQGPGSWMNAFVYVDMDKNGFTAGIADNGYTPTGDLVSYSFYNQGYNDDENGRNSAGASITGDPRSTLALPNWTVPADLAEGEYRIRFKYDWCNINPAGDTENYFGNSFTGHGGEIIDAKLIVERGYVHNTGRMNRNSGEERGLTTFTLTDGTNSLVVSNIQDVNSRTAAVYVDKSDQELTTYAGATLKFTAFNYTGSWMHAYAYVDYNNDKSFTLANNNDGNSTGEIVSYNYYDGKDILGNVGNTNGEAITSDYAGNSKAMPAFTLPADLEPGKYRMRIKIDWDNIDADYGADDIAKNGGCQCDITIVIIEPCTITYNYKEGNKLIASISHETYVGADYPALDTPACEGVAVVGQRPDGKVNEGGNFDIQVTTTGIPFEFANSYDEIDVWYYSVLNSTRHDVATGALGDGKYMRAGDSNIPADTQSFSANDVDSYSWAFIGNPFENAGFKMVSKNGKAIKTNNTAESPAELVEIENGTLFTVKVPNDTVEGRPDAFCLLNGSNYLNLQGGYVKQWTDKDKGSTILLTERKEFNVTVSDLGFATLYLDYAAYIPSDVEVYTINGLKNNDWLNLVPVEGTTIPANQGFILKNAGDYKFVRSTENVTIDDNLLSGTVETDVITKEDGKVYYILANDEKDGVGMYIAGNGGDNTTFKNYANKAYLVLPKTGDQASSASLRFDFGGTTAIEEVETENAEVVIYDLAGRRVNEITEGGIYIIGGRKVLVK